nr:hypothetical protein [uncultured Oscillibacter sp.]
MSKDSSNQHFTPPRKAKPIDPVQRFGMEVNCETIYVVFCGGFPTLSAYLYFQKDVEVCHVSTAEELRGLLTGADGIPADLAVIYSPDFQILPPMAFFSPVDGHETMVQFSLDAAIADEDGLNEWCSLIDSLRAKKRQFVEGYKRYSELYPESKEDSK